MSLINPQIGELPADPPSLPSHVLSLFLLKGKVASVTGSSQGIGLGVAEAFAQAGADVAFWYNSTDITQTAEEIGNKYNVRTKAYKCQISSFEEVRATILQQENDFGHIDVFVANAGIGFPSQTVVDTDIEFYHKVMATNLDSVFFTAKVIGEIFKKQGHGSFIATASQAGHIVTVPHDQAAYNATKAAVRQITKTLAVEWAGFARANLILPGYVLTDIAKFVSRDKKMEWWKRIPLGREGEVKELVGAYLYFASEALTWTTGSDLIVDGGYTCV